MPLPDDHDDDRLEPPSQRPWGPPQGARPVGSPVQPNTAAAPQAPMGSPGGSPAPAPAPAPAGAAAPAAQGAVQVPPQFQRFIIPGDAVQKEELANFNRLTPQQVAILQRVVSGAPQMAFILKTIMPKVGFVIDMLGQFRRGSGQPGAPAPAAQNAAPAGAGPGGMSQQPPAPGPGPEQAQTRLRQM